MRALPYAIPKSASGFRNTEASKHYIPVVMSNKRMYLSSWAVINSDMVGCDTILLICVAGVPSTSIEAQDQHSHLNLLTKGETHHK